MTIVSVKCYNVVCDCSWICILIREYRLNNLYLVFFLFFLECYTNRWNDYAVCSVKPRTPYYRHLSHYTMLGNPLISPDSWNSKRVSAYIYRSQKHTNNPLLVIFFPLTDDSLFMSGFGSYAHPKALSIFPTNNN